MNPFKAETLANSIRKKGLRRLPRPKKIIYPKHLESAYQKILDQFVEKLFEKVDQRLVPKLKGLTEQIAKERGVNIKLDSYSDDVANIMASIGVEFEREYSDAEIRALARRTGKSVDVWNERQVSGSLGSVVDVDLFGREPWLASELDAFVIENVSLIKNVKEEFAKNVQDKTIRALGEGRRWEEIAGDIFDTYEVSKSRANLIARDQVGKLQGQLTELRQKEIGIDEYIWRTAGDGRVRESHQANEGKTFKWSDPPATGHPGQDYQCRCYAEPVLSKFLPDL